MDGGKGALPAGFQFGAYVIGSCIGQGGMARIYRAEHRMLRKAVALKVMESALLEKPDGRPRFLREGQAAAAVKHPNVVDITDVGVWEGRPYLVMELLEGEDLERYLSRHEALAEPDVARIMLPVIAGLATAHAAGVIHRDLKPSNVFLARGPDGEVVPKLLDFGISKLANALRTVDPAYTPLGELMGSPMYMSPEAVRGERDLTPQSDQYSLGVMLYECVTGRPPFCGDSLLSVLEAVAHGRFEPPRRYRPDLSALLEVAILRAMRPAASDRYPTVRDLGRALCDAADQRTRLLWTPSFGARDAPLRSTTHVGSSPFGGSSFGSSSVGAGSPRTGSPLSVSISRWPRRFPYWRVGLSALAVLMLAAVWVTYSRLPSTDGARPSSRLRAADRIALEATAPLTPQGPAEGRALGASAPSPPAPPPSPAPRRTSADETRRGRAVGPRAPQPADVPRAPSAPEAEAELGGADEVPSPVRAPAPSRPSPVLGANQSPILD